MFRLVNNETMVEAKSTPASQAGHLNRRDSSTYQNNADYRQKRIGHSVECLLGYAVM